MSRVQRTQMKNSVTHMFEKIEKNRDNLLGGVAGQVLVQEAGKRFQVLGGSQ